MSTSHNHARVLAVLRGTWTEYLVDNGWKLTQESAEDFLASAHDALGALAGEIQTKRRLGVATEVWVWVFWEKKTRGTQPFTSRTGGRSDVTSENTCRCLTTQARKTDFRKKTGDK